MTGTPFRQFLADLSPDLRGLLDEIERPDETESEREAREQHAREDLEARERAAAADRREQRRRLLVSLNVPARAAAVIAAESVRETPAVVEVRAWMRQDRRRLLFLAGDPDAGKTTAASVALDHETTAWLLRPYDRAPGPHLVRAHLLGGAWQYYDRTPDRSQPFDPLTRANKELMLLCRLLVLDDVGQEADAHAEVVGTALDTVITERCDRGLRTIVTTNDTQEAFFGRYAKRAQRLGERLTEHGEWKTCDAIGMRRTSNERRSRGGEAKGT